MNEKLAARLYDTYPALYAQHALPMSQTAMCWGFECGDGWFDIINDLSSEITELDARDGGTTEAVQVKEKFGMLRFYTNGETNAVSEAIARAEERSAETCEACGNSGELRRNGGWLLVRCDECFHTGGKK